LKSFDLIFLLVQVYNVQGSCIKLPEIAIHLAMIRTCQSPSLDIIYIVYFWMAASLRGERRMNRDKIINITTPKASNPTTIVNSGNVGMYCPTKVHVLSWIV